MSVPEITLEALTVAAQAASEKQAENIAAVDVAERLGITDAFLFASAETERQVIAVVDNIQDSLREKLDLKKQKSEGESEARWVLLDYGHFVVHVQVEEEHSLYALERLWNDAPAIDLGVASESESALLETQEA